MTWVIPSAMHARGRYPAASPSKSTAPPFRRTGGAEGHTSPSYNILLHHASRGPGRPCLPPLRHRIDCDRLQRGRASIAKASTYDFVCALSKEALVLYNPAVAFQLMMSNLALCAVVPCRAAQGIRPDYSLPKPDMLAPYRISFPDVLQIGATCQRMHACGWPPLPPRMQFD